MGLLEHLPGTPSAGMFEAVLTSLQAQLMYRKILMTTDTIILIDEDDLSVWDVPKLKSNASALSQDFEPDIPVKPRCTIRYPDGYSPPAAFTCKGLCDWYTGSPQPLWYDLLHTSDEGYLHHFDRFEADISDLQNLNATIKRLPSFELPQVGYVVDSFIMPYRACGQNIVVAWRSRQGVHCHIGSSSSTCPRRGDVTLRLTKSAESSSISFCPVSGRLAYIKATGIEVIDYLWPNDVSRSAVRSTKCKYHTSTKSSFFRHSGRDWLGTSGIIQDRCSRV